MSQLAERYQKAKKKILEREYAHMNEPQRQAVFTTEGPVLVLAGAGSGKTTVLINRSAYLLKYGNAWFSQELPAGLSEDDVCFLERFAEGVESGEEAELRERNLLVRNAPQAWQLMTITFTNKAAAELKHRLAAMLGEEQSSGIWAMTFHASCARMLRRDAALLGFTPKFTIYDAEDQKRIIKQIMGDLDIDDKMLPIKTVIAEISRAKNSLMGPEEYAEEIGDDFRLKRVAQIYQLYRKRLTEADAMDFDDLLFYAVKLLESNDEVREYYQHRFRYIMVDEFQDTNQVQNRFVNMLAAGRRNLCVVGDDDQSIYRFRGATIENILSFDKNYSDAAVIRLEQNYRSTQKILDAANSVIANNKGRHAKRLWTANGEGDQIMIFTAESERSEAEYIAQRCAEYAADGGRYSDCAVLYRVSAMSGIIESHLMRAGVPYRVVAGRKFYDRKEIRDAIAYLSVINNPSDEVRMSRIINEPKRGIGERSFELASEIASGLGISIFEVLGTADQYAALSRSASKLKEFHSLISSFIDANNDPEVHLDKLLEMVIDKTGYRTNMILYDEKSQERLENLQELASSMIRYEQDNGEEASLGGFLEDVALITDVDSYDEDADCVSLMTLHAAKGLEFPVVFIPGAEEGIFPGMLTQANPEEVEEDRRLAYVGITRAKKKLYITHAMYRTLYGHTVRNKLSRYVEEIDPALTEKRGGVTKRPVQSAEDRANARMARFGNSNAITAGAVGGAKKKVTFSEGDTVRHKIFGEGTVLSASSMGSDTLLEVKFEKVGVKKLMANFAALEKL